jgi:hypothetical protein
MIRRSQLGIPNILRYAWGIGELLAKIGEYSAQLAYDGRRIMLNYDSLASPVREIEVR